MSETKTKILDLAEGLIRRQGYHAFSYKDISVPLAFKNAAVHYHFPAKEDLGVAIIDRTRISFRAKVAQWEEKKSLDKIASFIKVYERSQSRNMVCIMGALGPAYDTLPAKMKDALTETSLEIKNWLRDVLNEGLESGEFHYAESADEKANMIISALLSSLILNKVTKQDVLLTVKSAIFKSI